MKTRRQMVLSVPVTELAPAVVVLSSREAAAAAERRAYMEQRPTPQQLSLLDRRNDKDGRRTGRVRLLTIDGVTKNIAEWAKHTGVQRVTILARLRNGWRPADAIRGVQGGGYNAMTIKQKQSYAIKRSRERMK